jgi:hypothetical protein
MTGIASPTTVDIVTLSPDRAACFMYVVETEDWDKAPNLELLSDKLNNYMGYALDGQLHSDYPETSGLPVVVWFDFYFELSGSAVQILGAWKEALDRSGIGLDWRDGLSLNEGRPIPR